MTEPKQRPERFADPARLSAKGREILSLYDYVSRRLAESQRAYDAMQSARAVHIAALKRQMIAARAGIDLDDLFDD